MDKTSMISSLQEFGIDLKLESLAASRFYVATMIEWFSLKDGYTAYIIDEYELGVEIDGENVASIEIVDSILRINSMVDDTYTVLLDILEFVATKHDQVVRVFDYLEENGDDINSLVLEEQHLEEQEEQEEEESEEDTDWGWI